MKQIYFNEKKHSIKVTVPIADNDGVPLDNQIETLKLSLTERYGGATVYNSSGLWISNEKSLMTDYNVIIETYNDEPFDNVIVEIIADYILTECRQLAACIIVDGTMRIYEKD